MSKSECTNCGGLYQGQNGLSTHWARSSECEYPNLTDHQHEIIRGLLMGDGCVEEGSGNNPRLTVGCVVPEYLEHLSDEFGPLGNDVYLHTTAKEGAEQCQESGFRPNAKEENYSDVYMFKTMSTPEMWQYRGWYDSGKKVWPEDLELTPLTLNHWFSGDGSNSNDSTLIRIAMSNERSNKEKVERYFEQAGLPTPDDWFDNGRYCVATWNKEKSMTLFEYMGEPLPGYEYKWPEQYQNP